MESNRFTTGAALAVLVLGGFLLFAGMALVDGQETSGEPDGLEALVGLGVTSFGALVLVWWALSFGIAVTAELLIRRGRPHSARRLSAFAPTFMRRAACLALGTSLAAAPSANADEGFTASSSTAVNVDAAEEASALSPQWVPIEAPEVLEPSWQPTALPSGGGLLVKELPESRRATASRMDEVVVQPGDSLWTIAARNIGPNASNASIAEDWPRWYAANKSIIGERPDLLQPGQILQPPVATPTDSK